ncbi:MAG: potassium channel family protein [Candidatus Krumholzibacteria bacterium]|nr:potassium channel family protein [Candidatus Krumholzibacteria bacterium]
MSSDQSNSQAEQYTHPGTQSSFFLYNLTGRNRALVLLLALISQILLTSLGANQYFLPGLFQGAVILAAVVVAADSRRHLIFGLALGVPAFVLSIVGDIIDNKLLGWINYLLVLILFLVIIRLMLIKIFKARIVTLDTIGYALCTYILLGTVWTLFYAPVAELDPHAFSQPMDQPGSTPGAMLVYFSFVTLTTLGYGDISPVSNLARSLAILEALTGTLFLAVLISRLVGSYSSQKRSE